MRQRNNNEIGFDEFKTFLARYKWLIITSTLLITISALVLAYFSPNVYQANSSIEIISSQEGTRRDIMGSPIQATGENMINEQKIIQSQYIIFKALENLNLRTRYFITNNFKKKELYKSSPFVITSALIADQVEGYSFQLFPVGEKNFRLIVRPPLIKRLISKVRSYLSTVPGAYPSVNYNEIHEFSKPINTPWFNMTIQQVSELTNNHYSFTITSNEKMFKFIKKGLSVPKVAEKGTILALTFEDTVPLRAKEILNSIGDTYVNEKLSLKTKSAQDRLNFIDLELKTRKETLENSANKLQTFKASNIIVNIEEKTSATTQKLSDLEAQLYNLKISKNVLENIHHYIETHNNIRGIDVSFQNGQSDNSTVDAIVIKIQNVNARRMTLLLKHTKQHPSVIHINKELISLKQSLKESIESSQRSTNKRISTINKIIEKQKNELRSLPKQEKQLASLTRNFMANEKIYSYLLEKRAETAIVESSSISHTRIINTALLPESPVKPKRILMIISGFILGIIIGIILSTIKNFLSNIIRTTKDIEQLTTIPVYGTLPLLSTKNNRQIYDELLRVLWTNIAFHRSENQSKLITFTSNIGGEGKTSTICELGKIIALSGKKIIVLDLDMRKSTLHDKCNLPNNEGMSSLLSGKSTLNEVVQKTKYKNFSIISSGSVPSNPTELIMSGTLKPITNTLLMEYDYVLLDSPPIGLVADAMMLMHMSDISLFLLKANYSKKEFVENINHITDDPDINPGIILNGIEFNKSSGYGYSHMSQYSSGYYDTKHA